MEGGLQALVRRETTSEIRRDRQLCKHLIVVVVVVGVLKRTTRITPPMSYTGHEIVSCPHVLPVDGTAPKG